MMARLKARRAEIARLREERGATDPILIIAGIAITLILLVGGSFAISGFIANAHNLNAQGDLERIATAQSAYLAQNDGFGALRVGPNVGAQNTQLQQGALGFTPTDGNSTIVRTSPAGWTAVTKSGSGTIYMRSSLSSDAFQANGSMVTDPAGYSAWEVSRTNLMLNSLGSTATSVNGYGQANGASVSFDAATHGARVSTPVSSIADSGINIAGAISYTPKASTFTVSMDVTGVTDGSWRLSSQGTWASNVAVSPYVSVAAGETKRVSLTFSTNTGNRGSLYLLRQNPAVASSAVISNVLFEETNTARDFFDGSTPGSELIRNRWTGASDGSISVLETRTIAAGTGQVWSPGNQPSGFTLPAGITWTQVAADIQDVNS